MTGPTLSSATAIAFAAIFAFGCDSSGGIEEDMKKMEKKDTDKVVLDPNRKHREIPSADLPGPTDEELAAWDRKDPEAEKIYYKFDKPNSAKMQNYWLELRCLRERTKAEGEKALGAEPGSPEQQQWEQFKLAFNDPVVNAWQQRMFAEEGRDITSKSLYISNVLEAHELVMNGYPVAYNDGDEMEIKRQDALWTVVENKVVDYADRLGKPMTFPDLEDPKALKKWDKFCHDVIFPKKKKSKKR